MTSQLTIQKVDRRLYVVGNSYPVKDQLKKIGCHWDSDRKQWWIGSGKETELQDIVNAVSAAPSQQPAAPAKEDLSARECLGKVEYKGRTYYVIGQSEKTGKLWLTVLDCSIDFWAVESLCKWIKRYEAREEHGSYGRGTERYRRQTLGAIQRFLRDQKNPDTARGVCTECGSWGPKGQPCSDCGGEGHHA